MPQAPAYPLIAFHAAAAAEQAGDYISAEALYRTYAANWSPVLRQDDMYATGLMALPKIDATAPDKATVDAILKHGDDQAAARLYGAIAVAEFGDAASAETILIGNLDRDLAPTESRRVLAALLAGEDTGRFQELVRSVATDEKENMLEAASLAALAPEPDLLHALAGTLSAATLHYNEGYLSDELELTLPTRVVVAHDAVGKLVLSMPETSVEGDAEMDANVTATFPYEIPDDVHELSVPISVKLPSLEAQFIFKGVITSQTDERWRTRVLDAAGSAVSGSATLGAAGINAASDWWDGKATAPDPVPEEPTSVPTVPVWRFTLVEIKGDGFCYIPANDTLVFCGG